MNLEQDLEHFMNKNNVEQALQILDGPTSSMSVEEDDDEVGQRDGYKALVVCFRDASSIDDNSLTARIKYLFRLLVLGDIVVYLYHPDDKISHDRYRVSSELEKWSGYGEGSVATSSQPEEEELELLETMIARGKKLVGLYEDFGTGSPFWLQGQLTNNL